MYTKVKLLSLTDGYEHKLVSSTGKLKKECIGQIGKVIHTCVISKGNYVKPTLYDVQFDDGAIFCLDEDQIRFVALGAMNPGSSNSQEELRREAIRFIDNADAVFSALGLLIENGLYYGQNKH
ncbi:hypothetical protein [uncultured Holdemanella sp.]|uniref:hypothetical protein n=1 Tax=uncultured Holdemanella sp. TaxID=1763549 RepID=UPI0025DB2AFA|nr:hypothetical protein [uncultured Holdemanella sp.]